MEDIELISDLVLTLDDTLQYFRVQDFYHGNLSLKNAVEKAVVIFERELVLAESRDGIMENLRLMMEAQKNQDYVLLADLLEGGFIPSFRDILQNMVVARCESGGTGYLRSDFFEKNLAYLKDEKQKKLLEKALQETDENLDRFFPEATNIGTNTLKYQDDKTSFYYHSNVNPKKEGGNFARYYAKKDCFSYVIFGFGMGYHIEEFLRFDRRFQVTAVETNMDVLASAFKYRDLSGILSDENFNLVCGDEKILDVTLKKCPDSVLLIHYPSLLALPEGRFKNMLNRYFINTSSMYSQKKYLDTNFYYNIRRNDSPVNEVMESVKGKSVIFIGAGPSLEDNIDYLKNISKSREKIIICASTSYRRLVQSEIRPDYVVIIDAKKSMVRHILDVPDVGSALIYLCTAARTAVSEFPGRCFIAFQNDYEEAEKYARENKLPLLETGGSVSTMAIDLLLRGGCSELITIGLDLAYTDGKAHGFDTDSASYSQNLPEVKSVTGKTVRTTHVLDIYRKWIEDRIKDVPKSVSLINVSRGAFIHGMKNVTEI